MPYDPETFQNLYPFPIRLKIEEEIKGKILNGELNIPSDQTFDSKKWINEKVSERYKEEHRLWLYSEYEAQQAWAKTQEAEYGFNNLPENLKQNIHNYVRENGDDRGEMLNLYDGVSRLVIEAYETGIREHLQRK